MEEVPEKGKESSHSARAKGMNQSINQSKTVKCLMMRSELKHTAVNKLIKLVLCVTVVMHTCDFLTPTGMSYLKITHLCL
jgi:hypothetical protein